MGSPLKKRRGRKMSSKVSPFSSPPPPATTSHTLTPRAYIPHHIYKHPAALLLELCASPKELRRVLPLIIKNSLLHEHYFRTKLTSLFSSFGCLDEAARVFDSVDGPKADVLYHTMLKGLARYSSLDSALSFFCRMRQDDVKPVVYSFIYLLKLCGDNADLRKGKEIHGQLVVSGFSWDLYAMTAAVNMYAKCKQVDDAIRMFDRMPERDLVCWNAMVSGSAQNGFAEMALELVRRMSGEGHRPDSVTVVSALPAATAIGSLRIGKAFHGYALRGGFQSMLHLASALVDMYSKCRLIQSARVIFDTMRHKSVVSWNSMIDGYVENGDPKEALVIFQRMLDEGVEPNNVTVMEALHACAELGDLERGKSVHELLKKLGLQSDHSVMNSLISMYSKCKDVDMAASVFEKLQTKTLVSWNAMILGYAQNGLVNEALNAFCAMHDQDMEPDSFTLVSVISALAELSIPRQAKWIHGIVIRRLLDENVFVMTALVDMYAKCGAIGNARKLFDMMAERHVITWNAMIDGYGVHGLGKAAVELFKEMENGVVKPNDITFLCALSACSHSGLVEEGLSLFESMKEDYGIVPAMDHYGAMVDLLGRAGRLNEAWNFIDKMPIQPGITVYGAMLGACRIHKNVNLGEKAAKRIFELNPDEGGYHVLLANIYATASKWDKMAEVRKTMEKKGIRKTPGCSLVEFKNQVHSFYSGTTSHPQSKEIYAFLEQILDKIKAVGYEPDTNSIHDVEDNVKEQLLNTHSEKLAISFGLLNTAPGTTIHIRKNLRVCGDCHSATKYISLVTKREIIVRDMHRFHHFRNGTCSCGDYW